jgi:hypothetical protein
MNRHDVFSDAERLELEAHRQGVKVLAIVLDDLLAEPGLSPELRVILSRRDYAPVKAADFIRKIWENGDE